MVQKSSWVKNSSLCQASYPSKKSPKNLPRKCTTAVRFIAFHRICNFTKQNSSQNLFGKNYQVIIETSVVQKYFDTIQRTLTVEGSITEWLVSSLRLDLTASSVTTTTYFLFGQIETLNTLPGRRNDIVLMINYYHFVWYQFRNRTPPKIFNIYYLK